MSDLVASLLSKRGITDAKEVERFLNPDYERDTHSPSLLEGMERAVTRLLLAIQGHERIAVYADFDCDGIPGAALLSDFFRKVGYENFEVYLPHRDREGYGFHVEAIEQLAGRGVSLIITVDVGTTAIEAVAFAKEKGIDCVVTDHHEIPHALPGALAVLNPKIGGYPFRDLCGAAVAFKLVQATLAEGKKRQIPSFVAIPDGWEKWLLDLVALATIADMVPLIGENRVLAHWGLQVLRKSPRAGLNALCNAIRIRKSEITEDDIGFSIAPRINAASRMGEPDQALHLLTTEDRDEAERLAAHLEKLNASRKGVVSGVVREARKHANARFSADEHVVVLGNPEWKPALLGLAANSIMNERGGIVCLWGRDAKGRIKGSCRSDGAVSIVDLFVNAGDVLEEYGGHAASGGFSVSHESVHALPERFAHAILGLERSAVSGRQEPDAHITLSEVGGTVFRDVSKLGPFGAGNPKPLFRISGVAVSSMRRFGKEKNHVEVQLVCHETGFSLRAFDFFRAPEDFSAPPAEDLPVAVTGTIERDTFRGGLTFRLVDIVSG
jgi:single-stranded-DNA-specific exonuclease